MSVTLILLILATLCAFLAAISGWVDHPAMGRVNLIGFALFFFFLSLLIK